MGARPESRANDAIAAEQHAEAWRLRLRGKSFREIGTEMGVSAQTISNWTKKYADELVQPLADEWRKRQLGQLDEMRQAALAVLDARHVTVSNGRVVCLDDEPLPDDGPVLQAIDRLLKIGEREAKLLGLDAPTELQHDLHPKPAELLGLLDAARGQVAAEERAIAVTGGDPS